VTALQRVVGLSRDRRRLLARALVTVAWYRAALWVLPFRWVRRLAARPSRRSRSSRSAVDIASAVTAAARRVPQASCLTQALALQSLLQREGYSPLLKLGVAKTPAGELAAHAWIEEDGRVLIGGPESARFVPLLPEHRIGADAPPRS
jgi:hypothetical protein